MGFRKYNTLADYTADPLAIDEESRVSLIAEGTADEQIKYDGRNVETTLPVVGDVLFLDSNNNKRYLKGGNMLKGTPTGWTLVGYVFNRVGNKIKIMNKTESSNQWLACWLYAITDITGTTILIGLRMSNNYNAYTYVDVTLTSAAINYTSANEISTAVATRAIEVGDTRAWWAWYDNSIIIENKTYSRDSFNDVTGNGIDAPYCWTNGSDHIYTTTESLVSGNIAYDNSITSSSNSFLIISVNNRIIVQTDSCNNYQQYLVTGTGCTIALCVWEDMPASSTLLRKTMTTSNWGVMNVARSAIYYGTNGTTPTSNIAINNANLVKRACFEDPNDAAYGYCSALREKYITYENYIAANKVKYPLKYGVFNLINAIEMTQRYGNSTAPTKSGGTIYKFPALHVCATVNYNSNGLRIGDWHLSDITDGMEYMDDEVLAKVALSLSKMGTTLITNSAYRWFGRRNSANNAWCFGGIGGALYTINVSTSISVRAVALLEI